MSARALTRAVAARLKSAAVLNDSTGKYCANRPNGKPPSGFGQIFYAVHWTGSRETGDHTTAEYTEVYHSISVTITARVGVKPDDRRYKLIEDASEILDLAEAIAAPGLIHGNYVEVMNAANALISGFASTTNGFIEPLWFEGFGPLTERGADWVGSEKAPDVFSVEVRFGRARRIAIA